MTTAIRTDVQAASCQCSRSSSSSPSPQGCGCSQDDMEDFVKQIENASNNKLAEMIRDLLKEMYKNLPKENNVEAKLCMYIINEAA